MYYNFSPTQICDGIHKSFIKQTFIIRHIQLTNTTIFKAVFLVNENFTSTAAQNNKRKTFFTFFHDHVKVIRY